MINLSKYKTGLTNICQNNQVISKLYLFGSALTPRFNDKTSDIDVLVETANVLPEEKGMKLMVLWDNLETLFGRKIDLLTENSLKNPFLKQEIEQTRKLIYDGQNRQIFI
ncbi:MAG: nucleotidyltransferase domain-containing protein [Prevotellaceae bacterium]|jgi:predicted nucleotidyltransferase|nr:nucleotidyltransferase domain-containing protein [Prevotellaceae bacterium]